MHKYLINEGSASGRHQVEAHSWSEVDSFVIFFGMDLKTRVFALPTSKVYTIRIADDD